MVRGTQHVPQKGSKILGIHFLARRCVRTDLEFEVIHHMVLLNRFPAGADVQASWLMPWRYLQARANRVHRTICPEVMKTSVLRQDTELFRCLDQTLKRDLSHSDLGGA